MNYSVRLLHEAVKTLERLDRRTEARIRRRLHGLSESPFPAPDRDIRPVKGSPGMWRLRVGDWRILYTVDEEAQAVYVVAVRPRGQAYR
ncbi:MAG: type II toxin-antitoxin system RelE/ParE family toxin [Firmicutes bacterium]|nr:type II toxin-antitoxin system RelE/ParE family toxin [Bacillota bacterium]